MGKEAAERSDCPILGLGSGCNFRKMYGHGTSVIVGSDISNVRPSILFVFGG